MVDRPFKVESVVPEGTKSADALALSAGPRPWLVRGLAMLGTVTALTGKGGFGKSTLTLCVAAMMVTGREFGWWKPIRKCKVLVLNGEEDSAEMRRRLAAICSELGVFPEELAGRLFVVSDEDLRQSGIKLFKQDARGGIDATELATALPGLLDQTGAEVLILDPLVASHEADENDNTQMEGVMSAIRRLARKRHMSVIAVHHDRKGTTDPTDAGRGASAIVDNVRLSLTLALMTKEDHDEFKPKRPREEYYQVVVGKANYTGKSSGRWLWMKAVQIATVGEDGVHDVVGVPVPVDMSALKDFDVDTWEHREEFLRMVREGEYLVSRKGSSERRFDNHVVERFGLSQPDAWRVIDMFAALNLIKRVSKKGGDRHVRDYWEAAGSRQVSPQAGLDLGPLEGSSEPPDEDKPPF